VLQYQRKISAQEDAERLKNSKSGWLHFMHTFTGMKLRGNFDENPAHLDLLKEINLHTYVRSIYGSIRRRLTPAGPFHTAMMFGPLVLEPGVEQ
jgi:hypothetical protein